VVTSAYRNALGIQNGANIMRVGAF
ncbi:uncharacterized protein METZ01_LOCUS360162, partial [marine metagenome]